MMKEEIMQELESLLKMDDVLACMVAKKGLEGIVPADLKMKDVTIWKVVREATDDLFDLIDRLYKFGLERLYFELGKYTVIIATINQYYGLIVVIPSLANMGLLDVEIENTKRRIKKIIEKE